MLHKTFVLACTIALLLSACAGGVVPQEPTFTPLVGKLTFAGSTTVQPLAAMLGDSFQKRHPQVQLDIAAGGSKVGIQAIHDGTVDIGMASRQLSSEEAQGIDQFQIASDVIAVVVHPDNPVKDLQIEKLRQIYLGEITNWSELGGEDLPIVPVAREQSSGTRGAFDELVLEKQEPSAANLRLAVTAGDMAAIVAQEKAAIGYVGFGNLGSEIKLVAINGILPSLETAQNGSYPLLRPLILMTGPLSQPLAEMFVEFVLSAPSQQQIAEAGWVPVK
ncbi:MAG: phosphate ABC transporter substrate-binding protein [Chloroflexota bacterium]